MALLLNSTQPLSALETLLGFRVADGEQVHGIAGSVRMATAFVKTGSRR
jgi:hypothetical protein